MKFEDYDDLKKGLSELPTTWYPALILEMVETAYKKKVFAAFGAASTLIKNIEAQLKNKCPDCGRRKAISARGIVYGDCPKWYAVMDQAAEDDCKNFKKGE